MIRQIILAIHIFLACIWVGGILFVGWGVFPATTTLSFAKQRKFLMTLMIWSHRFFTLAGAGVIITGILLGTIFGPIRSWDIVWNTSYGQIWVSALMIGIVTLLWGVLIGYKQMMNIFSDEYLWREAEDDHKEPLYRELFRLAMLESVEILGFLILIFLMVSF